jgi:hypothetical protein
MTIGTTTAAMVTTPHSRYVVTPFNAAGVVRFQVTLFLKWGPLWENEKQLQKKRKFGLFLVSNLRKHSFSVEKPR